MVNKEKINRKVSKGEAGERIDLLVADWLDSLSRNRVQKLIRGKKITVNGKAVKASHSVGKGEKISIILPDENDGTELVPQSIDFDVLYEDQHIIGVNKPPGLVVHPGPGHPDGTLVNGLLDHCGSLPETDNPRRPGIVHRLDKETSGVLVGAKTEQAYNNLVEQFKNRSVFKEYLGRVQGVFEEDQGVINAPVGRSRRDKTKMAVTVSGKPATTRFSVWREINGDSLLKIYPQTGRTHQIRVHMNYIGHPIVGDSRYGGKEAERMFLHAYKLRITHPESTQSLELEAPIPALFRRLQSGEDF